MDSTSSPLAEIVKSMAIVKEMRSLSREVRQLADEVGNLTLSEFILSVYMTDDKLIRIYYKINEQLFLEASNPLKCHGPDHHLRVCFLAIELAKKENIKYDSEVLIPACMLHDLAAFDPDNIGDNYHEEDHKIAKKVLKKIGNNKTEKICEVISKHGTEFKSDEEKIEATLLRDADKLDALGPIGISRMIMSQTKRGLNLNQIVEKFYTKGKIKEKYESITTKTAKNMAKADYKYSLKFFADLQKYLNYFKS